MSNKSKAEVVEVRLPAAAEAAKVGELLRRVDKQNPAEADKQALQAAFRKYPDLAQRIGDLARRVRQQRAESMSASNHLVVESIMRVMESMEHDLGYEQAPAPSKLLIQHVVTCWLDLSDVQRRHGQAVSGQHSMSEGTYWDRRLSRAQARYLKAVEALARVNRLYRVVPVQINVAAAGGQQINLASADAN